MQKLEIKWRKEGGRKQGSKEARKQGRKQGSKEARKQGSKEGRKEARKSMEVELNSYRCVTNHYRSLLLVLFLYLMLSQNCTLITF